MAKAILPIRLADCPGNLSTIRLASSYWINYHTPIDSSSPLLDRLAEWFGRVVCLVPSPLLQQINYREKGDGKKN